MADVVPCAQTANAAGMRMNGHRVIEPSTARLGSAAAIRRAAGLLAALCLAGCGGPDRGAQVPRPPAADSTDRAPSVAARDSAPPAADASPVPVMVGGDEDFDACGGVDEALGPVAVRSGPGDHFTVVEQLERGARVFGCGAAPDTAWEAVVVIPRDGAVSCGVSSPIPTRQAYSGTCKSGWVRGDSFVVVAG
jgi:hypothetical protein